ncbi:creatininase family protein [Aminobacter sp. P9b]|uniref:Creatinine amidohydrolase n=1 Tax=Aminobacter niigataensis TaxID=83265 RepID=A0ABR6L9B5_9HYPH|nr:MULTISPECIES: creatininase family protein [Aminobacter]AWC22510.1 Creatinine amidohydrolase [Aminobacter sp. MSH1]MBB4653188.1 creatinine amidohydrolase [Aminobacter niigataensis]PWK65672.1 creatinine amidohydrolase [Aminobacter sp. AP02]CAI2933121.1 Creatinine amidohydrolase [Aminobacter niigataensis]
MLRYWADYTSAAFAKLKRDELIAVLPVSAIEQHGPHLPVSVDTTISEGVVAETIKRLPDDLPVVFLPGQRVGKSNEHSRFPGTLTLSADTLLRVLMDIGESVAASGVRKLVLLNSHGGQTAVLDIVARDLRVRHGLFTVATATHAFGMPSGLFSAAESRFGIHAGDKETSMMLALRPDLVDMSKAERFVGLHERLAETNTHLSIGPLTKLGWQIQDLHPCGACGDAAAATADKGKQGLEFVAERFVELLREIHEAPLTWLTNEPAW